MATATVSKQKADAQEAPMPAATPAIGDVLARVVRLVVIERMLSGRRAAPIVLPVPSWNDPEWVRTCHKLTGGIDPHRLVDLPRVCGDSRALGMVPARIRPRDVTSINFYTLDVDSTTPSPFTVGRIE